MLYGTNFLLEQFINAQNVYHDNSMTLKTLNNFLLTLHSSLLALSSHERKLSTQDVTNCHMKEIRGLLRLIKKPKGKLSGHSVYNSQV